MVSIIMWKNRTVYIIVLTGAALFSIMYPFWFSRYFMVMLVVLALFDFIISLPGMFFNHISYSSAKIYDHGEDAAFVFTVHNKKRFKIKFIKIKMKSTCEDLICRRYSVIRSENGSRCEMKIDSSHSGLTVYEAKRIWIVSYLGLFCIPVKLSFRTPVLILPISIKPPNTVALPQGTQLRPKPGGGFSDEHDLRPFRFGDTNRSIHWKVSAKLDTLIIREPLTPLTHSRLIHVSKWNDHIERDMILGRLRWVSEYLSKWNLPHYVSLDICGTCTEIKQTTDLYEYLYLALNKKIDNTRYHVPAPNGIEWVYHIDAFEHMESEI